MTTQLSLESSTLAPLPSPLRNGLIAVTILAFLSFVSTALLVIYITYRLVKWERLAQQEPRQNAGVNSEQSSDSQGSNDLTLGLEERHYHHVKTKGSLPPVSAPPTPGLEKGHSAVEEKMSTRWNPVLMLIYNLLCANLIEAMAFLLSVEWLRVDGILVPTATCWAQGWFMQVGKLSCSGMLVLISINTYTTVVRGFKLSSASIYAATASVWVIAFGLPLGGVVGTQNGVDHGGFYARAGAWCWVNSSYSTLALWLEYFWIFVAMAVTVFLLVFVLVSLHQNNQSARHFPPNLAESMEPRDRNEPPKPSGHHPAFLVYQIIYIICTAPLAISRVAAMTGTKSGWVFYGIAGAMIASHGWLNVVLWSTTIIFIGDQDIQDTGLERFAFLRTPQRRYGNVVLVKGGNTPDANQQQRLWWPLCRAFKHAAPNSIPQHHSRNCSQESLRRSRSLDNSVIGVEIEAKVVIEDAFDEQGVPITTNISDKNLRL